MTQEAEGRNKGETTIKEWKEWSVMTGAHGLTGVTKDMGKWRSIKVFFPLEEHACVHMCVCEEWGCVRVCI